jgi:hypothetical protein
VGVALAAVAGHAARALRAGLGTSVDRHGAPFAGSASCRHCHPAHDASWRATFHRTMTQEARAPGAVRGAFDGRSATYLGYTTTFELGPDGAPRMTTRDASGSAFRRLRVERTVGSRRYQQYLAAEGGEYRRLPWAWHVEDARWFHLDGAFLGPDPPEPAPGHSGALGEHDRHVVRWNDNCVFCHNVGPRPGLDARTGRFATEVAELGVGCEACHGPGEAHARRNADPLRRYALHLGAGADPTITNPARLSPERAAMICARCHGQRLADDVGPYLRDGDPFVPGDDLGAYTRPLWAEDARTGAPTVYADRFWGDGTPRLTAYEYQGLLQSACARGGMTCTTCHGMHEGDPHGQLRQSLTGSPRAIDAACTGCHTRLGGRVRGSDGARDGDGALRAHTGHAPDGEGARCVGCHMPRVVYGLVDVHRSHRVEVPDPARDAAAGRPDACTLCHTDRTRAWAIAAHRQLWPGARPVGPDAAAAARPGHAGAQPSHDAAGRRPTERAPAEPQPAEPRPAEPEPPELARALAGGDPITRAVAADALGRPPVRPGDTRDRRLALLVDAMAHDRYPAVRRLAWRSARRLARAAELRPLAAALEAYEATAPSRDRAAALDRVRAALPARARDPVPSALAALRAALRDETIVIGE